MDLGATKTLTQPLWTETVDKLFEFCFNHSPTSKFNQVLSELADVLRPVNVEGIVVGGMAVIAHGYRRTTMVNSSMIVSLRIIVNFVLM
jgi:hypothetical protein